ncbi:RNA polymerase sigma factor [Labilithrix luteola]|uniref:RNA polymerase sigma factor n=1 Tax=Labilithrix luteola TaxID=1391654 RepID=UPI0011BA89DE|nr:RNA polymerase sigma factor [Labilithrix luteola]
MKVTSLAESLAAGLRRFEKDDAATLVMPPRELFQAYAGFVWRTLKYQSVAERDLDDLSQEVFLIIFKKLPEFEPHGSLRSWIYGISIRVAAGYRKRARHRMEVLVDETPEFRTDPSAPNEADRLSDKRQFTALIARLDEEKRAVFVLHTIENLPMAEVAEIVGVPLKTAHSRLATARKQLLEMLSKSNRSVK